MPSRPAATVTLILAGVGLTLVAIAVGIVFLLKAAVNRLPPPAPEPDVVVVPPGGDPAGGDPAGGDTEDLNGVPISIPFTVANPGKLTPTKAVPGTQIPLPAEATYACLGGNGRFLLLQFARAKQVAVLDVCAGKIVQTIPLPDEEALIAAGNETLFVYTPKGNHFERWNLATFNKETTHPNPLSERPRQLVMGHASDGPLYAGWPLGVIDTRSFQEVVVVGKNPTSPRPPKFKPNETRSRVRVSADGRVVAWCAPGQMHQGMGTLVLGDTAKIYPDGWGGGAAQPGPDGTLFTHRGLYTPDLKAIGETRPNTAPETTLIPAAHGPLYLSLSRPVPVRPVNPGVPAPPPSPFRMSLRVLGDNRPIADVGILPAPDAHGASDPLDRVFLVPEARALVVLSPNRDRVTIESLELTDALDRSEVDYLVIASRPPGGVVPGSGFSYKPVAKSRVGGVTFRLADGPEGMTLAADGTVVWDVPKDLKSSVAITIVASDRTGQEVPHSFTLSPTQSHLIRPATVAQSDRDGAAPLAAVGQVSLPKPRITFPNVQPVAQKPAPLEANKVELKLPGKVTDHAVGGRGRYWCFVIPEKRQIAVFDANEAKFTGTIPLASEKAQIAAGMNKLVVAYEEPPLLVRYDLATFQREAVAKLPFVGRVRHMVMGSASAGPVWVHVAAKPTGAPAVVLLDLATLQQLDVPALASQTLDHDGLWHRAGPDSRVFGSWSTTSSQYLISCVLSETGAQLGGGPMAGIVAPAEGGILVTGGGIFTSSGRQLDCGPKGYCLRVRSQNGPFYLSVPGHGGAQINHGFQGDLKKPVKLYRIGDQEPIATLPDLELPLYDDRLTLFAPANGLIGLFPPPFDKLVLHKFDLEAVLNKAGADFLFVTSVPHAAEPGKPYRYRVEAKSDRGAVHFSLDAGPPGMTLAPDGTLSWAVPVRWSEPTGIVVSVTDASGMRVPHGFTLTPPNYVPSFAPPPVKPATPTTPSGSSALTPQPGPKTDLVRAAANPAKITPTKAPDVTELRLSAPADWTCVGGGGRYILFRVPPKEVAVLDVCEGKFLKSLTLSEPDAFVAAGNEHAYLVNPRANTIDRWNLTTQTKEATFPNPAGDKPKGAAMGNATDGPLLIVGDGKNAEGWPDKTGKKGAGLVDGLTGKSIPWPAGRAPGHLHDLSFFKELRAPVRMSGDGRVIGYWLAAAIGYSTVGVVHLGPDGVSAREVNETYGPILLGRDDTLYGMYGMATLDGKLLKDNTFLGRGGQPIPAVHGPAYLSLFTPRLAENKLPQLTMRILGEERPIGDVNKLSGLGLPKDGWSGQYRTDVRLLLYDRLFLIPDAKALIALDDACQKVTIHHVDPDEAITKSGGVLFVANAAPPAKRGTAFRYQPKVVSKSGVAKLTLENGPVGMKLADGILTWDVPTDFADNSVTVILGLSDPAGQEGFHVFTLSLGDGTLGKAGGK